MPQWLTFRRTSGRDLKAVRRPVRAYRAPVLSAMNKTELVDIADERGLPASGTKAELVGRLAVPEIVEPADD